MLLHLPYHQKGMVRTMKLNEIREIVDFMKEAGVCELEYQERHTSIRLKLAPPAPPCPAPEEEADKGLGEAAEKMRKGAALAGSAVADTVRAGASYLKSKRDEYLAGTPGAYDVELSEAEESAPEAPEPEPAPEEMPVVGEVPEYVPQEAPEEASPEEDEPEDAPEDPVKLDTDAAREAVARTAEVVVNAAKAAVELGAAGLRRGGSLLSDLLRPGEPEDAEVTSAEAAEEAPAPTAEEVPGEEDPERKEEEV